MLARYGPSGETPLPNPYPVVAGLSNGTHLFYNDATHAAITGRLKGRGSA